MKFISRWFLTVHTEWLAASCFCCHAYHSASDLKPSSGEGDFICTSAHLDTCSQVFTENDSEELCLYGGYLEDRTID